MNKKYFKRGILIFLLILLGGAGAGRSLGWFNGLSEAVMKKNVEAAVQELNSPAPSPLPSPNNQAIPTKPPEETSAPAPTDEPVPTSEPEERHDNIVAIVKSPKENAAEITKSEIEAMVKDAIDQAGGFEDVMTDGQTVVIKPNLVQMKTDSTGKIFSKEGNGITTDWRVTNTIVQMVRRLNPNGKVYIMECSATGRTKDVMEYLNYTHEYIQGVTEFIGIDDDSGAWQDFDSDKIVKVDSPQGLLHKEYYFNKHFYEADVVISVPCLKTTTGVVITAGIKNISLGVNPVNVYGVSETSHGRTRMVSHKIVDGELDKWIFDYYNCKPAEFVIVDGLVGFQNGPVPTGNDSMESDKMNMGLIIAGRNAASVDTVCAHITGWDPKSIGYLQYFEAEQKGVTDINEITISGSTIAETRKDFEIRTTDLGGVRLPPIK